MHKVFLGIGGNIGNKRENFEKVLQTVDLKLGKVMVSSSIYETPPWGFQSEDNFWNQVFQIETELLPEELLDEIHKIENDFRRVRGNEKYSSREMDIDILYYDDIFMETENLIIPHPRIQLRKFVLVPLVEIEPDFKHPLLRLTNFELFENCRDNSLIKKVDL